MQPSEVTERPTAEDVRRARRLIADDVALLAPVDIEYRYRFGRGALSQRDVDRVLDVVLDSPEGRAALRTLLEARCA